MAAFVQSACCLGVPYACMTGLGIDRFLVGVDFLEHLFDVVYWRFLDAVDHVDCHPAMQGAPSANRGGRSVFFSEAGFYDTFDCSLGPTEDLFLDRLLVALESVGSTLTYKFNGMRGCSVLAWVLGWGVFSNLHSIGRIKKNLGMLQDQNLLQDK